MNRLVTTCTPVRSLPLIVAIAFGLIVGGCHKRKVHHNSVSYRVEKPGDHRLDEDRGD